MIPVASPAKTKAMLSSLGEKHGSIARQLAFHFIYGRIESGNSGFLVDSCDNSRHAGSGTVSTNSGNRGSVVRGASGTETGGGRGPRLPGPRGSGAVGVCGVRGPGPALRPPGGAGVAAPGHLPVSDDSARPAATSGVPGAWGAGGEVGLGGTVQPVHGAV